MTSDDVGATCDTFGEGEVPGEMLLHSLCVFMNVLACRLFRLLSAVCVCTVCVSAVGGLMRVCRFGLELLYCVSTQACTFQ